MINSHFGFTPLKEVWLGDCYPESFYSHLPLQVQDAFAQITEWTKQDLTSVETFLKDRNIIVKRPTFNSIDNYIDSNDHLVKPPITPRDHYIVLGNTLYSLHNKMPYDPWQKQIDEYLGQGYDVQQPKKQAINCVYPPSIVRVGRDIYIDVVSHKPQWGHVTEWLVELAKNYRVNICNTDGHSDSVFCPLAHRLIGTSHWKTDYSNTFPGWEVFEIKTNNLFHNEPKTWSVSKEINDNQCFVKHINDLAIDWVGDYRETVFEVNMLVVDEHNVIIMKENEDFCKWLEKHGITAHCFDMRTRTFWDGGWHCLTLDIHRQDTKQDLFPFRGDNGIYWRDLDENTSR